MTPDFDFSSLSLDKLMPNSLWKELYAVLSELWGESVGKVIEVVGALREQVIPQLARLEAILG